MKLFYIIHQAYHVDNRETKYVAVGKILVAGLSRDAVQDYYEDNKIHDRPFNHRVIKSKEEAAAYGVTWHGKPDIVSVTEIKTLEGMLELIRSNGGVCVLNEM